MATLNHPKTNIFSPSPTRPANTSNHPRVANLPPCLKRSDSRAGVKCVSLESSASIAEASGEVERDFEEAEWGRWKEKCRERRGLVEVLECLEREAIMGEDEGREPGDYNRRAHIFDESSRVFQALKYNKFSTLDDDDQITS